MHVEVGRLQGKLEGDCFRTELLFAVYRCFDPMHSIISIFCHHLLLILSFFSLNLTFGLQPLASLLKKRIKMQYYFMKKYFREIWKWTFWKFDTLGKLLRKHLLFKSQSIYYQDYGTCLLYSLLKLLHKEANSLLCSIGHFSTLARLESLFFSKSVPGIYLLWDILSVCLITLAST